MMSRIKKMGYIIIAIILFIFTVIMHRGLLTNSIGIDTEVMLALKDVFFDSWYSIGRFGLVWLKKIEGPLAYNIKGIGYVVIVLLLLIVYSWTKLYKSVSKQNNIQGIIVFALLFLASCIMTEQLYFKLQAVEICIGLCLIPLSAFLCFKGCKKGYYLIFSVIINIFVFSLYQVMVPLFIMTVASCFYLHIMFGDGKNDSLKNNLIMILKMIIVFLISFVLNQIIVKVFFIHGEDYLGNQIMWGKVPSSVCILNIWNHIKEVMFGSQIYYAKPFSLFVLLGIVVTILEIHRLKKNEVLAAGNGVLAFVVFLFVSGSIFMMTILCGTAPVVRSQLVYPFVLAFVAYIAFLFFKDVKWYVGLVWIVSLLAIFLQVKYTTLLNTSDAVRYDNDVIIATMLSNDIDKLQNSDNTVPVIFYGAHAAELTAGCIKGDVIGYSIFEWDTDVEPCGVFNSRRVVSFMKYLGIDYLQADEEITKELYSKTLDMPLWPNQGSVQLIDNVIVVKLGNN